MYARNSYSWSTAVHLRKPVSTIDLLHILAMSCLGSGLITLRVGDSCHSSREVTSTIAVVDLVFMNVSVFAL